MPIIDREGTRITELIGYHKCKFYYYYIRIPNSNLVAVMMFN